MSTVSTARRAPADHLATARRYAAHPHDWPFAPRFDPLRRWYHRLATEPDSEVWLLSWLPGHGTDLHDHGGSTGAFVVISGTLTELTVTTRGTAHRNPATTPCVPARAGRSARSTSTKSATPQRNPR